MALWRSSGIGPLSSGASPVVGSGAGGVVAAAGDGAVAVSVGWGSVEADEASAGAASSVQVRLGSRNDDGFLSSETASIIGTLSFVCQAHSWRRNRVIGPHDTPKPACTAATKGRPGPEPDER